MRFKCRHSTSFSQLWIYITCIDSISHSASYKGGKHTRGLLSWADSEVGSGSCRTLGSRSLASVLTSVCTVSPPYQNPESALAQPPGCIDAARRYCQCVVHGALDRRKLVKSPAVEEDHRGYTSFSAATKRVLFIPLSELLNVGHLYHIFLPCFDFTSFFQFPGKKTNQEKSRKNHRNFWTSLNTFENKNIGLWYQSPVVWRPCWGHLDFLLFQQRL